MKSNKTCRIGVRLSKIQLQRLNAFCKHNHITKSKFVQNEANYASSKVSIKEYKEPKPKDNSNSYVVDSNSKLISSVDRLYRISRTRYRQSAGVSENINQIAKLLHQRFKMNVPRWQNWNKNFRDIQKLSSINCHDDKYIWQKLKVIEKEMTTNASHS